jgi:hypothetical protein
MHDGAHGRHARHDGGTEPQPEKAFTQFEEEEEDMTEQRRTTTEEARRVGDAIGVDRRMEREAERDWAEES